jgi:translation initiation factor 1 (eIF-1/SUI1)
VADPKTDLAGSPSVSREEVASLWAGRMEKLHSIVFRQGGAAGVEEVVVKKGTPPIVTVSVKRIQGGRKATTHCVGADDYRVDLASLGRSLQLALAASATVQPHAQNPRLREVMVQGDESERVAAILVAEYGVPRNCVKVVEEAAAGTAGAGAGGAKRKGGAR